MDALRNGNIFKLPLGLPKAVQLKSKQQDTFSAKTNVSNATQIYNSSVKENFAGLYRATPAPAFMQNSPFDAITINRPLPSIENLIDVRLSHPVTPSIDCANLYGSAEVHRMNINNYSAFENHTMPHSSDHLNSHTSFMTSPHHADSSGIANSYRGFDTSAGSRVNPPVGQQSYSFSSSSPMRGGGGDMKGFAEQQQQQQSSHDSPFRRSEYSLFPDHYHQSPGVHRFNQHQFDHPHHSADMSSPNPLLAPYSLRSGGLKTHPNAALVMPLAASTTDAAAPAGDFWRQERPKPMKQQQQEGDETNTDERVNNKWMEHTRGDHAATGASLDVAPDQSDAEDASTPPPVAECTRQQQSAFMASVETSVGPVISVDQNSSLGSASNSAASSVGSPIPSPVRAITLIPVESALHSVTAVVTAEPVKDVHVAIKPPPLSPVVIKVQSAVSRTVSRVGGRTSGGCDSLSMLHIRPTVSSAGPVWPASSSSSSAASKSTKSAGANEKSVVAQPVASVSKGDPPSSGQTGKSSSSSSSSGSNVVTPSSIALSPKRPQSSVNNNSPVPRGTTSSSSSIPGEIHSPGVRKKHPHSSSSSPIPPPTSTTPIAPAPQSPKKSAGKKAEVLTRSGRASVKPDRTTYEHGSASSSSTSSRGEAGLKQAQAILEAEKDRTNVDRFRFGWHLNEHKNFYALKASLRFAAVHVTEEDPVWFEFVDAFNLGGEKAGYPHRSSRDCIDFFNRNLEETIAKRKASVSSPTASASPSLTTGDVVKRRAHNITENSLSRLIPSSSSSSSTVTTTNAKKSSSASTQQHTTTKAQSATEAVEPLSGPKKRLGAKELKQLAINAVHDPVGDDAFAALTHHTLLSGPNTPQVKALLKRQLGGEGDVKTPAESLTKRPRHRQPSSSSGSSDSSSSSDGEEDQEGVTVEYANKRVAQKLNLPHKRKSQSNHRAAKDESDIEDDRRKMSKLSQLRTKAENDSYRSGIDPKTKRVEVARRPPKGGYHTSQGRTEEMQDDEEESDGEGSSETFSDEEGDW